MLPAERRQRIKEWMGDQQNMKISELSDRLGVSEMTIHRDIKPLVEEGIVIKTFGGITLVRNHSADETASNECVYCSKNNHETLAFRLILPNDRIETACCGHCGLLRYKQLGEKVIQAVCGDFLRRTTISAVQATFVMDTSLDIGCCQPQVLTFEQRTHAEKFVKGFGGMILSFSEALDLVDSKMNVHDGCRK
ncbi:MAG TPA: DeoR family transcriptional regulator [Bacillales bacterium]|nr:DeoR family transcriptional regulator [Bacillales bacterium]